VKQLLFKLDQSMRQDEANGRVQSIVAVLAHYEVIRITRIA
jgi:hypothetical protein